MDRLDQAVAVTLSAGNWAKVIAGIAKSPLTIAEKEELNSIIYDTVIEHDHLLNRK